VTLYVDRNNPAYKILSDEGFDVRPASEAGEKATRVLLVNQMPTAAKENTILGWSNLIQKSGHDVVVTFIAPGDFHKFSEETKKSFAGLIVTGANIESNIAENMKSGRDPFHDIRSWASMKQIFNWAKKENCGNFFSCIAGPMALYHYSNGKIKPKIEDKKRIGFSEMEIMGQSGAPARIKKLAKDLEALEERDKFLPVARYFRMTGQMLRDAGLRAIVKVKENDEAVLTTSKDGRTFLCAQHPEYRKGQIRAEIDRDVGLGKRGELELVGEQVSEAGGCALGERAGIKIMTAWLDGLKVA
jgi:homoserine O-succinyltransferase